MHHAFRSLLLAIGVASFSPWVASGAEGYVGSKACASCHRRIYNDYLASAMGRSVSPASEVLQLVADSVTVKAPELDRVFTVFRKDGRLYQSEYQEKGGQKVFDSTHEIQYAVGSGANGISFIVRRGNHLFQAPLSYYAKSKSWDVSPGYEHADHGFSRPIHEACIVCHSGRPRAVPQREGEYLDPAFEEMAVGCENCHGPGVEHARSLRPIVNPRKLPPRVADDICMKCHQSGDTRILLPGRQYSDIVAGEPLYKFLAIFRVEPRSSEPDLLEHHEAMKASRCFQNSSGRLSCLSCHSPHGAPPAKRSTLYYRAKCLNCHKNDNACRLAKKVRVGRSPGDDCVGCHMPKRTVKEISHSALTNHRIGARTDIPIASPRSGVPSLIQSNAPATSNGSEGLPLLTRLAALGELLPKTPGLLSEYLTTLDRASRELPDAPLVLAARGRKLLQAADPSAAEVLSRALGRGNVASTTYFDLAEALSRTSRLDEAIAVLENGQRAHPFSKELRKSLILRRTAARQYDLARKDMEAYLEIFPEDAFMRQLLADVVRVR